MPICVTSEELNQDEWAIFVEARREIKGTGGASAGGCRAA